MGIIHCDIKPESILLKINIEKNKSDIKNINNFDFNLNDNNIK